MIKITKRNNSIAPNILITKGKLETSKFEQRYNAGEREFLSKEFNSNIYGHESVKELLIQIQDNKCCFCESKIGHISYGDVEHFRPKAGWVQENEQINKPGYYWLAYDLDNLLLSCQICNQRHKKNLFPLTDPATRAVSHNDNISNEEALFLNPNLENIEEYITFNEEIPKGIDETLRGEKTIEKLGLDRELLNEQRRAVLNPVRDIYELAKGYPETNAELKLEAKNKILKYYNQSLLDTTEYASMLRAFFEKNLIDF
jgi:uncharacterized protein (TIGR02646 family)